MWDVVSLLNEYKDLLPQICIEAKGIKGELSELKIELHLVAKTYQTMTLWQWPKGQRKS